MREESSVCARIDEFGEVVFRGDAPGPVVHRTPEELGLERVVKDVPVRVLLDEGRISVRPCRRRRSRGS